MNNGTEEIDGSLLHHFQELDRLAREGAPFSCERYETLVTYSWRKRLAARYHLANVRKLLADDEVEHQKANKILAELLGTASLMGSKPHASVEFRNSANYYAYELSAFLEALKSSVDIAAEAASIAVPGFTANFSITPLLRAASRPVSNVVLSVVQEHRQWLEGLRDYRHHLVHRLMPTLQSGYRVETRENIRSSSPFPVVVPRGTPPYIPDTRLSRSHRDEESPPAGLDIITGTGSIRLGDSSEKMFHFEVRARPAEGYLPIEQFMIEHLDAHERFFVSLLRAVEIGAFKKPAA